jgi:hypothetical protein
MGTKISKKTQITMILTVIALVFNSGCGEGMKMKPIYNSAFVGGIVGAIVGNQVDRQGEGIAIGASIAALGEVLKQIDEHPKPRTQQASQTRATQKPTAQAAPRPPVVGGVRETYTIQIHNDNGSITPVEIRKDGNSFIGPTGERYEKLPSEEQLKPFYGL